MKGEDGAVLISMRLNSGTGGSGSRLRSVVKICKQKIDCQIDSLLLLIRIDPFLPEINFREFSVPVAFRFKMPAVIICVSGGNNTFLRQF